MVTETYPVSGMTCGHCVASVDDELRALSGVTDVRVSLVAGGTSEVTVTSESPLPRESVAAAIDEAGYVLASPDEASPGAPERRGGLPLV